MTALEMATTEELVEELERRHAALTVAFLLPEESGTRFGMYTAGGLTTCIGLLSRGLTELHRSGLTGD